MNWLKLAILVLGIVRSLIKRAERAGAIAEGERIAIARATRAIDEEAGIARAIEAETAGMTPEAILRDLDGRQELRD